MNIAVMATGVSFFGYIIGTISTLVTNLNVSAARYDERMMLVKEYIQSRRMPKHMSNRIRDHFEYYYQNRSVFDERKILKRLPSALRNEMVSAHGPSDTKCKCGSIDSSSTCSRFLPDTPRVLEVHFEHQVL